MLRLRIVVPLALCALAGTVVDSQQLDPARFGALKWRLIGPFRAGRVSAGSLDLRNPNVFYVGTAGGGVWKSTNAGQTWRPIFDETGVASIGAVAVAPSDPGTIYVGTGEETQGNGVYKSTDGGRTWHHLGLRETHYIGSILIDAVNPNVVLVGAIGDRTAGPNRGVYRTADGGATWTKVLTRDDQSGCPSIVSALDAPNVMYASVYPANGSRGAGARQVQGVEGPSVFRSTDAGVTWTRAGGRGLTGPATGRQGLAIAAGSRGRELYAGLRDGLYRSVDGGENWTRWTSDPRIRPFGVITDPRDPAVLYVTQTAMYRSSDGGRTFEAIAGAPSGDDFQLLWIDPADPRRLLAGVDQGAVVSADGGESWSSWYNQPTGQFYHVSTDNAFPYRVYAAQQDSGTAAVPSRSNFGEISYRDWYPAGGFEFGYVMADPLNSDVVFSGGWYRTVVRYDRKTGQIVHVFAPGSKFRLASNAPMAFLPEDPHALLLGTQYLMKTVDAGMSWRPISPDLTEQPAKPPATAAAAPAAPPGGAGPRPQPGVITTFSPSPGRPGVIWAGTSNGLAHLTEDGGRTWRNVTPSGLPERGGFEIIDAGRHDAAAAFATFIVPQDTHPFIYRTRDRGRTWNAITSGLPDNAIARVIREDPVRKGLLFCGTEAGVYVSFDDGDRWQPLQLNLPATSMRDMVVKGDDLVLATYGRGLWILDNITPLRQLTNELLNEDVHLFTPAAATRVRWDVNEDTPLPIETPVGANPPEGAMIDYFLKSAPPGDVRITILDSRGDLVRAVSSVEPPPPKLLANAPEYWFANPPVATKHPGLNRFAWNLRYANPKVLPFAYSGGILTYVEYTVALHAIPGRTPREQPEGPFVVPGQYTVEIAAGGKTFRQPLTIKPDPRVGATQADLVEQLSLLKKVTGVLESTFDAYPQATALRGAIADRLKALAGRSGGEAAAAEARKLDERVVAVQSGTAASPGLGPVNRDLARIFAMLQSGDARPATSVRAAAEEVCQAYLNALAGWRDLNQAGVPALNTRLGALGLPPIAGAATIPSAPACGW